MTSSRSGPGRATASAATVVGIDGCPGGWIEVRRTGADLGARFLAELDPIVDEFRRGRIQAVAIDMPIGLLNDRPRACDRQARQVLGPRRSSVFPTPLRSTLDATDYRHACELSRAASGKALSKQAFNLLPKIAELDRLVDPEDQDRLVEAHPECGFVRLAGRPLEHPKRTEAGRRLRQDLLRSFDPRFDDLLTKTPDLPILDLVDAAVLTITAGHVHHGTEHRLGCPADVDDRGLRAEVVY